MNNREQSININTSNELYSLSPLGGRYKHYLSDLEPITSEFGLIKNRVKVEIAWFLVMARLSEVAEVGKLTKEIEDKVQAISKGFSIADALQIKSIEKEINHDVKAVEYFIKDKFSVITELQKVNEFIHFGCTSEDINNLSYALMLKETKDKVLLPKMNDIITNLVEIIKKSSSLAMISLTHGQPATPTTMGKELANVAYRLKRQAEQLKKIKIYGKFNGAVGNYNALYVAYPNIKWLEISEQFVKSLGLSWMPYTTQIEPHDYIAEYLDCLNRFNVILLDLNRDIWSYISLNYFAQKQKAGEVGSSTMPHKVNPIDFENSEGNLGLAISINEHLSRKLPISRMQRDLSDSTVLRNLGVGLGYSLIAYSSLLKGLKKLQFNSDKISADLQNAWILLAEAVQTVMRKYKITTPYEKLKDLTRGKAVDEKKIRNFINSLNIEEESKQKLLELTPQTYLGKAVEQANAIELALTLIENDL